jgi:branched-chain amino acid transport system ATP-binding protein
MSAEDVILETHSLVKEFNGFVAVDGVSVKVRRCEIHALIGPNGAGKTTFFNLLTKFLQPTSGTIFYQGRNITKDKPADIARHGVVRSFQICAVFPHLTALENVRVALQRKLGTSFYFWRSEKSLRKLDARANELLAEVHLESWADTLAADLPYGRKRALELATTLALEPALMLLDEPTQGMGHEDVSHVTQLIKGLRQSHRADGRAQHERGRLHRRYHFGVAAWPRDCRGFLCRGLEEPPSRRGLHGHLGCRTLGNRLMAQEVLKIANLQAWYGESHILHGVEFSVQEGEVVTLLGRNGAGRTTTLRAIMGLVGSRTGSVLVNGTEAVGMPPHKIARLGLGYCPEERGIFAALSTEENLLLPPRLKGAQGMQLEEIYDIFPNLLERAASPGTRLSGGEQQMLAVARILRTGARLLLLDEISEGLAPVIVQKLGEVIRTLRQKGITVVLVEQNFRFAAPLADRFYVMEHGKIVKQFAQSELASQMGLLQEFLGV